MTPIVPRGTRIAVVAPSGVFRPDQLARGLALAREAGHVLEPVGDLLKPVRYLAAPDTHRLDQLVEALTDDRYGAVWAARGGFGVTRLLRHLPWERLEPRPLIGFSDLTPLLDQLRLRGAQVVHGPVLHSLPDTAPRWREHLFDLLAGEHTAPLPGTTVVPGTARGPLVGGNLALLAATCGTPWQLRAEGAVLCFEDVHEPPYRVDRLLTQLHDAGVFDGIVGVAAGTFVGCRPPEGSTWTVEEVVEEHLTRLGVPVITGLPFGHASDNAALPLGRVVELGNGHLTLDQAHA